MNPRGKANKVGQASRLPRERVSANVVSALPTQAGATPAHYEAHEKLLFLLDLLTAHEPVQPKIVA